MLNIERLKQKDLLVYLIKRLIYAIPIVFSVITFSFILIHLAPGDPAVLIAGEAATPEYIENIRKAYGLDKPIHEQYFIYITRLIMGDWGYSISFRRPVLSVIFDRLPTTILLAGTGLVIAVLLGVVLGVVAAVRRDTPTDYVISSISMVLYSIPIFVLAQILIFSLAVEYKVFPISGYVSIGISPETPIEYVSDVIWHLTLPSISLALILMAMYVKLTRSSTIEVLLSNYITAARARGIPKKRILFKHALRNALIPVATMAGIQLGMIVGGVVITETIFSWPGIGRLTVEAIQTRDYPLLTGIFIFVTVSVVIANLITDLIYTYLDPRIRLR